MTEKKAIKFLDNLCLKMTYEYEVATHSRREVLNQEYSAVLLAKEALEKQIPKKPTYVDTRFRNRGRNISDGVSLSKCYRCPNCNSHIFYVFESDLHCKHCGQALDWGEEE